MLTEQALATSAELAKVLKLPLPERAPPPPPPFVEGVFFDMPAETYHAIEAVSQSGAKVMRQSMAHYHYARRHPKEPTDAMKIGTLLHGAVLEPHRFESMYMVAPTCQKRSNADKETWRLAREAAAKAKVLLIDGEDVEHVRNMRDAVLRHEAASRLLAGTKREVSMFWVDQKYKVPCKARADAMETGDAVILSDVKSTDDASADEFGRSIANFAYHAQAAHYISGAEHLFHKSPAFVLIVVEKEPPYGVACYAMQSHQILAGGALMDEAYARYAEALASGKWPAYSPRIEPAVMPGWALKHRA